MTPELAPYGPVAGVSGIPAPGACPLLGDGEAESGAGAGWATRRQGSTLAALTTKMVAVTRAIRLVAFNLMSFMTFMEEFMVWCG
jgi:hypothetical protein